MSAQVEAPIRVLPKRAPMCIHQESAPRANSVHHSQTPGGATQWCMSGQRQWHERAGRTMGGIM